MILQDDVSYKLDELFYKFSFFNISR